MKLYFFRKSGHVSEATQVSVDKLPSMCIADNKIETERQSPVVVQPLVVRESGLQEAIDEHLSFQGGANVIPGDHFKTKIILIFLIVLK